VAPTLNAFDNATETRATVLATGFNWQNGGGYGNAHSGLGITEEGTGPLSVSQVPAVATDQFVRRLTPRETERLQGFPDDWTLGQADSHRYRQMGNAVTVNVAEYVGHLLLAAEATHDPYCTELMVLYGETCRCGYMP
jgi:hypothetical protein